MRKISKKNKQVKPKIPKRPRFTLEKKLVVQVRYYEHMYMVKDAEGNRVFTGSDEKTAKAVLAVLNAQAVRRRK